MKFDSERQVIEKEHAFNSENRVCFKCDKRGHVSKYCQAKKKFISKTKREQQNLVAETEAHFSFLSGVYPGEDLVVDSGATRKMVKDRDMFVS